MYLRTILELEEEGVVPMRARIAERLDQSGPTVSQTVARMERDGLVRVADDRHLDLTEEGRRIATRVMRKHRLAEGLSVDGLARGWGGWGAGGGEPIQTDAQLMYTLRRAGIQPGAVVSVTSSAGGVLVGSG